MIPEGKKVSPEKKREYNRRYYLKHRDEILQQKKTKYANDPDFCEKQRTLNKKWFRKFYEKLNNDPELLEKYRQKKRRAYYARKNKGGK